jgi:uracil-DNA glycosylase
MEFFTDAVIQKISDGKEQVVFCCGVICTKKGLKIDRSKHLVLESGHPSPMSANQGNGLVISISVLQTRI